jgi:hypothetical protein
MFSSLSVLRLDDYVYTTESFKEAKNLLTEKGTAVLAFDSGRSSYITKRIFLNLARAFGQAPNAYFTGYDGAGVVFVEGHTSNANITEYPEISNEIQEAEGRGSTDQWPFLYLKSKTVPIPIIGVVILFLTFSVGMLRRRIQISQLVCAQNAKLFFLGAGFLLLETKAITELSLLFGSTWIVNAFVITAFLIMGLIANTVMIYHKVSLQSSYIALFVLLVLGLILPYSVFNALPQTGRTLAAALFAALPVFFSGLIFSRTFRDIARPEEALGVNLMGAVLGGILENIVMIGGTPILGALAILIYALSALPKR